MGAVALRLQLSWFLQTNAKPLPLPNDELDLLFKFSSSKFS
jgi:hypothetical protein